MTEPITVVDLVGQPLTPGDRIAYTTTAGRSAVMKVARIVRLEPRDRSGRWPEGCAIVVKREEAILSSWQDADREVLLGHPQRIVKVQ